MGDGLVVPENIPGTDIDAPGIEGAADKLSAVATALKDQSGVVLQAWRGLSASYVAPESATLLGALDTIDPAVEDVGDVLDKLSGILVTFAEKTVPIRTQLIDLKEQAVTFVAEARAGYTVEWWHPDHPASDYGFFGFMTTDFADMGPKWIPWDKYTEAVERNYELYSQINEQVALLDQARVEAVNAINALNTVLCVAPEVAIDAESLNLEGVELPWGSATRGDRTEYESLEDGANQALIALLDGIGALMAIDAQEEAPEDALFQWDLAGQAWSGLAQGIGSILYSPAAAATQLWGEDWPQWMQDAAEWDSEMLGGMYEGFVGTPEEWERDPWYAGGKLGFNAASLLVGGGVSATLKGGSLAARLANFVDAIVPGGRFLVQAANGLGHDLAASTRTLAASLAERWGPRLADEGGSLNWLENVIRQTDEGVPDFRPDADVPTPHHDAPDSPAPHPGDGPTSPHGESDGPTTPHGDPDGPATGHGGQGDTPGAGDGPGTGHGDGPGGAGDGPGNGGSPDPRSLDRQDPQLGNNPDGTWDGKPGLHLDEADNAAVQRFASDSVAIEQRIGPELARIVDDAAPGSRLVGLDESVKFADSLKGKVAETLLTNPGLTVDGALATVKDSVRYTVESTVADYSSTVIHTVEKMRSEGYEMIKFSDTWDTPGYKGINSSWVDPQTGRVFEVQFHTPEGFVAKTASHDIYDQLRTPGLPPEEIARLTQLTEEAFAHLEIPPGAVELAERFRVGPTP